MRADLARGPAADGRAGVRRVAAALVRIGWLRLVCVHCARKSGPASAAALPGPQRPGGGGDRAVFADGLADVSD